MKALPFSALCFTAACSALGQDTTFVNTKSYSMLYDANHSNPDKTLLIHSEIDKIIRSGELGEVSYFRSHIPIRSETLPEMGNSKIWQKLYRYSIFKTEGENYTSGYKVYLTNRNSCDPDPFKGSCAAGSFYGLVNNPDYISSVKFLKKEPLTRNFIPLSCDFKGYLSTGSIEWLYNDGYFVISAGDYPIENVILANASNPDLKDPKGPNYNKPFVGKINKNLKINMQLRRSGKWLWGTYFYDRGQPVPLKDRLYVVGSVAPDGSATLREYAFDNAANSASLSGTFKGKLSSDKAFTGSWSTPKGSKTFSFSLQVR